jgi:hypothetical protein
MRLALVALCALLALAEGAHAGCGEAVREPAGGRTGVAPLAIGDSVMLGAAEPLARAGFEVDALCARNPVDGLELMRKRRRRGTLPEITVVALGTNRQVTARDVEMMLRVTGRRRTLMLVTPFRSGRPFGTAAIRQAAKRHPRRVRLIDWASRARRNGHWIAGDGTHLTDAGERAYTRLLKRAAWSRQRGRFGRR